MKAIGINGSPRKDKNTAVLLQKALEGAASQGAETELVHLYDLLYRGCASCFACKRKDSPHAGGLCAIQDALSPVLGKALQSDVILLGSPIYMGDITGMMHSFLERLIFPSISYEKGHLTYFKGRISVGFLYTMNLSEPEIQQRNYPHLFQSNDNYLKRFNGLTEYYAATNTYQFDHYDNYVSSLFDEADKAKWRTQQFPLDCEAAFQMGIRLCLFP